MMSNTSFSNSPLSSIREYENGGLELWDDD